jgi:L-ascorbate metabolism protein UlaG (beta-lactamase superfamily)
MADRYYAGPLSDHFDGLRFYNHDSKAADKSLLEVLRWTLSRKPVAWPAHTEGTAGVKPAASVQGLRLTHIGHATTLLQVDGLNILVDPVYAERASPFTWTGPRRHTPPAVALGDVPKLDVVLVTHNHYDHMDPRTIAAIWRRDQPRMILPLGNNGFLRKQNASIHMEATDWWQELELSPQVKVTMVPSYHWSSRKIGDYRKALWGGYVLETSAGNVYLAGDTAYRDGTIFREIQQRWKRFVVALLPIGAYAPRYFMQPQHTSPEEAVQIALDCNTAVALGIHWGTFPLSDEPYAEPAERFNAALSQRTDGVLTGQPLRPGDVWEAASSHGR